MLVSTLLLNKSLLLLGLPCYQFLYTYCRITLHYLLPYIYIYIYIYIYTLPSQGLSTQVKELTAATCVMQSSSNEKSTLVSDNTKCKQAKATTYAL